MESRFGSFQFFSQTNFFRDLIEKKKVCSRKKFLLVKITKNPINVFFLMPIRIIQNIETQNPRLSKMAKIQSKNPEFTTYLKPLTTCI